MSSGLVLVSAAGLLAVVLTVAAVAKLRDHTTTMEDFASLGLAPARLWARAVPVLELATAGLLVVNPGWGGVAAFGLLTAFTANLALVIRSGRPARCACFGGASAGPVSGRHLLRNVGLLALAAGAATLDGWIWNLL